MSKVVVGDYLDINDVEARVNELTSHGYSRENISLISSPEKKDELRDMGLEVEGIDELGDDGSVWDRIKHFFTDDEGYDEDQALDSYHQDIDSGRVLVVLDEDADADAYDATMTNASGASMTNTASDTSAATNADYDARQNDTIDLKEERLVVDKDSVEAGEVVVNKKVVEQMETIQVPVSHEEVVIERQPVTEARNASDDFSDESITIPLRQEQVHVTKEPVVTEEVHIKKQNVKSNQEYSTQVRHEELDIDKEGRIEEQSR